MILVREKILHYKLLEKRFIYASVFSHPPRRLFLCIWPASVDVKKRAILGIRRRSEAFMPQILPPHLKKCPEALPFELFLRPSNPTFQQEILATRPVSLKFNKTANHFDAQQFFWQGASGHRIEVQSHDFDSEGNLVFPALHPHLKNKKFLQMLASVGQKYEGKETLLENYLLSSFDIASYGSYSFAVYVEVAFSEERDRLGQRRYVFSSPLPDLDCDITGLLYEYTLNVSEDEKPAIKTFSQQEGRAYTPFIRSDQEPLQQIDFQMDLQEMIEEVLEELGDPHSLKNSSAIAQALLKKMMEYYGNL